MAIIYTYPVKGTPLAADLVLISDTADGNKSKNATIASLVTSNAIDVVDTLNSLKGDVSITGGANITVTPSGQNIEISTSASNVDGSGTAGTYPVFTDSNTIGDGVIKNFTSGGDITIPRFIRHEGDSSAVFGFNNDDDFIVNVNAGTDQVRIRQNSITISTDSGTKLAAGPDGVTLYSDTSATDAQTSLPRLATTADGVVVYGQGVSDVPAKGGTVRFYNSSNNRYVGIKGPLNGSGSMTSYEVVLPANVGLADQVLKLPSTIGSTPYQLAWGDASGDVYTAGFNIGISGTNVISATNTTYTAGTNIAISGTDVISSTTPLASTTAVGGFNLLSNTNGTAPTVIYTTAGRNYAIQRDSSGRAMVNVPWTNTAISLTTSGTGAATLTSDVLNIPTPPTITASQGLTKTSNNITLDIADPTTGWAILGGGAGASTPVILGYAGANATGNKNYGISGFINSSTVTSADQNVAVGFASMGINVSTASRNVVVGYEAGESMTTALDNVLVGFDAGESITVGQENIIIGSNAGETITTGTINTIIGSSAVAVDGAASTGAVAIGRRASATTGSVAVGTGASVTGATGTAIGEGTSVTAANGIAIGQGCSVSGPVLGLASATNPITTGSLTEPNIEEYLTVVVNGVTRYIALYSGTP